MKNVMFNHVVNGSVVAGPFDYEEVLQRTGLKDTVGFTEKGYIEIIQPVVAHVFTAEQIASNLRSRRNWLLAQADWTQLADATLSAAKKAEWATYRQALRDLPETNSQATTLEALVFPDTPT